MGTDFVFIHGGGRAGWCWTPTIEEMARSGHPNLGRLVALDMPGWGAKKDAEDCTMAGYVASAIRDIEDAGLRDIVVVGHSFAGLTIPYIVTAIPERFKRVVFMACAVPDEGDSLRDLLVSMGKMDPAERIRPAAPRERFKSEWDVERSSRRLGRERAEWLVACLEQEFERERPMPVMEKVARDGFVGLKPASWIVLTRDRSMPPSWQRKFAAKLGIAETEQIELGGEHDAMISSPKGVAEVLLRWA